MGIGIGGAGVTSGLVWWVKSVMAATMPSPTTPPWTKFLGDLLEGLGKEKDSERVVKMERFRVGFFFGCEFSIFMENWQLGVPQNPQFW